MYGLRRRFKTKSLQYSKQVGTASARFILPLETISLVLLRGREHYELSSIEM